MVPGLPDPRRSNHPHAHRAGDLLFVSGLVAGFSEGVRIGVDSSVDPVEHDVRAQFKSIMNQLDEILKAVGLSRESVVDSLIFLKDLGRYFADFNDIYGTFFKSHWPARTTVGVVSFPSEICVEAKFIASFEGLDQ
jgi:enamine deaminase RidA (YjgF/YER057c/UK114 family)